MKSNTEQNLQIIEKLLADESWWTTFLNKGAILRESESSCWIWFSNANNDPDELSKNKINTIVYKTFFGRLVEGLGPLDGPIEVPISLFKKYLLRKFEVELTKSKDLIKKSDFKSASQEGFEKSLREIFLKINRGEIEKAVPIIFCRSKKTASSSNRMKWLLSAIDAPKNLWVYGFWKKIANQEVGIMGVTPEILFDLKEGRLETMALAGTLPKSEAQERGPLLSDPKERWEHDLVVQDLKLQLAKFGGVICGETELVELPTLFHLRTKLAVNLSAGDFSKNSAQGKTIEEMIQLLHPTPALGVSPRSYGYQWMSELPDQADRNLHGAPICFSLPHRTLCLVAIRNIQWDKNGIQIGAGCGIVKESRLAREWSEVNQKISSVFQSIGIE
jgi:isochorismate synthase EntC